MAGEGIGLFFQVAAHEIAAGIRQQDYDYALEIFDVALERLDEIAGAPVEVTAIQELMEIYNRHRNLFKKIGLDLG